MESKKNSICFDITYFICNAIKNSKLHAYFYFYLKKKQNIMQCQVKYRIKTFKASILFANKLTLKKKNKT